jgi:LysR family transcriptional regulator, hypochlorite-specific transcription factor HypT
MDTKWLEDFVSLAETRSFSRSAQLRHVTQPAFSRRIQSLEAWAGTDLVDRSSYPTRLTPAGQTLHEQALEMLQTLQSARTMLRAHSSTAQDVIEFAMPHTLAFTFFPGWLSSLADPFGPVKSRVTALNVHDAVMRLTQGGCDLLIAYHHPAQPLQLDPKRYEMLPLGRETLAPYVKPTAQGAPMFALPASGSAPQPYLAYASGAYLAGVAEHVIKQSATPLHLERVYETDMSEGLKAMALEGHGIAFLPASAVRQELRQNKLVLAMPGVEASIDIRVYRERSQPAQAAGAAEPLWQHLLTHPLAAI